jgi:SH3-like domain-containing protein
MIATLTRDQAVDVIGAKDDWYHVALPNGQEGWMERRAFE